MRLYSVAAALAPLGCPENNHPLRPTTKGRIAFSAQLLSNKRPLPLELPIGRVDTRIQQEKGGGCRPAFSAAV